METLLSPWVRAPSASAVRETLFLCRHRRETRAQGPRQSPVLSPAEVDPRHTLPRHPLWDRGAPTDESQRGLRLRGLPGAGPVRGEPLTLFGQSCRPGKARPGGEGLPPRRQQSL